MKRRFRKNKKIRVIPGFHLTLGITVTMLSLIVLIPLASVMVYSLKLSPSEFFGLLTKSNVLYAFATSIGCSFLAACINVVFGVILAWTLTRYDFPGKRILDGFIELPFALPTAVAGITLSKMYSFNYKYSYYLLKQNDYVNKIFNSLNFDNSELEGFFKQLMVVLNNYIDKRIGVVNA